MATAKTEGFRWLPSYYEATRDLPDEQRLQIWTAMIDYGFGHEVGDLPPLLLGYFKLIAPTLEKSVKFEAKQKANGQKGGRPRKPKENPDETQTEASENLAIDLAIDVADDIDIAPDIDNAIDSTHTREDKSFDEFWEAYPKKTGHYKTAYNEFLEAIKTTDPETIIAAVKRQSENMTETNFRYLPSAENWLKNKAWLAKSDFKEPEKKPQQETPIAAWTPPEKRHQPYILTEYVEYPVGSNHYVHKSEVPKDGAS